MGQLTTAFEKNSTL